MGILGLAAGMATMFVGIVLATPGLNFGLAGLGSVTLDPFHLQQQNFLARPSRSDLRHRRTRARRGHYPDPKGLHERGLRPRGGFRRGRQ
jgi:hypothetical protein